MKLTTDIYLFLEMKQLCVTGKRVKSIAIRRAEPSLKLTRLRLDASFEADACYSQPLNSVVTFFTHLFHTICLYSMQGEWF